MKKGIVSLLLVILMLVSGSVTAYASPYPYAAEYDEADYLANKEEIEKGYQIEALFEELRSLDADKLMEEVVLRETETDEEVIAAGMERIREEYQKKGERCEEELAKLGVINVENGFSASANGGVPDFTLITLSVLGIAALISLCRRKRKVFAGER